MTELSDTSMVPIDAPAARAFVYQTASQMLRRAHRNGAKPLRWTMSPNLLARIMADRDFDGQYLGYPDANGRFRTFMSIPFETDRMMEGDKLRLTSDAPAPGWTLYRPPALYTATKGRR